LAAGFSAASALPVFTFNPGAVGLTGTSITADNLLLSNFLNVTAVGATGSTETGFLSVTGFQLGGSNVDAGGLNTTYSLYFRFDGAAHLTTGTNATDPRTTLTAGVLDSATFSLIAAAGNSTFGFSGTTPTVSSGATQVLATGSLVNGTFVNLPTNNNTAFVPSAEASVTFNQAAGKEGFFAAQPFYNLASTAFTNTVSTVTPIPAGGGYTVANGGGNLNFLASPIPEPETYALLMAGLGILGLVARRQKNAG